MATKKPDSVTPVPETSSANESEIQDKLKELEKKVATLSADNTRLKNELRFTTQHQKRMSNEKAESQQREIDELASQNDMLRNDLMRTKGELRSARQAKAKTDAEYSHRIAIQSTALAERLAQAGQERERETEAELTKALKWKEKVIAKMTELDINLEDIVEDDELTGGSDQTDKDMMSLVDSLRSGNGAAVLQKVGTSILEKVASMKEKNRRDIQDLVDLLRQDLEGAKAKKLALENDVGRLRQKLERVETNLVDTLQVKTLQSQLQAAIVEKDHWRKRADKYEDALETLKIVNSLQKSLSKEDDIKSKYERELQRTQSEKLLLTNKLELALQERNRCVKERNDVIQERNALALQAQQEYERAERLHRLVVVLRKKAQTSAGSTK